MAAAQRLDSVTVTLAFLCFNTKETSLACFDSLVREAERLEALGATVHIMVRDNGNDGTYLEIVEKYGELTAIHVSQDGGSNVGQSRGRNLLIEMALEAESDLLVFMDGDIQVVPLSLCAMVTYMLGRQKLGCLSAHPVRQTTDPELASKALYYVGTIQNDVSAACSGYAVYRCDVFRDGIRFETGGPFSGPGWGLEDDDIYLEMTCRGWLVWYFTDMVYLQQKMRSSWPALYQAGVNISECFRQRQQYLVDKWSVRDLPAHVIEAIKNQSIPEYTPEPTEQSRGYRITNWGGFQNLECLKCQYATLWLEKMNKHLSLNKHPWAYPGQYPKSENTGPVY